MCVGGFIECAPPHLFRRCLALPHHSCVALLPSFPHDLCGFPCALASLPCVVLPSSLLATRRVWCFSPPSFCLSPEWWVSLFACGLSSLQCVALSSLASPPLVWLSSSPFCFASPPSCGVPLPLPLCLTTRVAFRLSSPCLTTCVWPYSLLCLTTVWLLFLLLFFLSLLPSVSPSMCGPPLHRFASPRVWYFFISSSWPHSPRVAFPLPPRSPVAAALPHYACGASSLPLSSPHLSCVAVLLASPHDLCGLFAPVVLPLRFLSSSAFSPHHLRVVLFTLFPFASPHRSCGSLRYPHVHSVTHAAHHPTPPFNHPV